MLLVLDARMGKLPEWRAFRALDSAIAALEGRTPRGPLQAESTPAQEAGQLRGSEGSYVELALQLLNTRGEPVASGEIFEFIRARRDLGEDAGRARRSIQTALSKDRRVRSVSWRGGRSWWYADRDLPI
jgi:hypothetical protein